MVEKKPFVSNSNKFLSHVLLWVIITLLIIQLIGVFISPGVTHASSSRQIGKSDVTIYTADVYNAGLEVPDEYIDEPEKANRHTFEHQ